MLDRLRGLGLAAILAVVSPAVAANAACPSAEDVAAYLSAWEARRPAPAFRLESTEDAYCAQGRLVEALRARLGDVVGYKAGLTSQAVQQRFGATEPARGVLLSRMILQSGTTVPAAFGARPVWESDMLLVVGSEAINGATTAEEVLRNVSGLRPFIELPDLAVDPAAQLDGRQLTATNVGARFGVAGPEIALAPTPETARALESVRIIASDATGATVSEGTGAAVLGSPLNAALWLVRNLNAAGIRLKTGDLLSVGSFSPLTPPRAGQMFRVRYEGLPGGAVPEVIVRFE